MTKIYNEKNKEQFLQQFKNQETIDVYKRIFLKSYEMEIEKEKDLFNFNEDELADFIKNKLKPKTKVSARTYCNVLSNYLQWGIENNFSKHFTNPLRKNLDYFYSFVPKKKLYISVHEKDAILNKLMNAQDQIIIQAIFDGICGDKVSELVSLKLDDIKKDENNNYYVMLKNKNGEYVKHEIEEKTAILAMLANKQEEYYKKNGNFYDDLLKDVVLLPKSPYVLKSSRTNPDGEGKMTSHYTVYNRLEMLKNLDEFAEYKDALNTKNILRSGMIYYAYKLFQRDNELGRKQIEEVCERFRINYTWALRDFLNEDTIKELYKIS
jgi:integrase